MNTESIPARAALRVARFLFGPGRIPPIPRAPASVRGILVVRQHDQLGDMLCAIPTLRALKDAYPGSSITLVASPVNYEIMLNQPSLDRVLLYDKRTILGRPAGFAAFRRELRAVRYDLAVVPSTVSISLTSGIIARLSGATVRIGPGRLEHRSNPAGFLYTHTVDLDWSSTPGRHQTLRNADILRPLGLEVRDPSYALGLRPEEREAGTRLLAGMRREHRIVFGMHPGAAKPGNRWPAERFAEVARRLHAEYRNGLVVTVGPRDGEVHDRLKGLLDVPHLFVANEPIRTVAAVIDGLDFFLSNDTGPLHIAGALRPRVLGLFGPTDPKVWAPPGRKNHFLSARDGKIGSLGTAEVLSMIRIILAGIERFD
jgi:ADP-heptose:LPS heptosyltransferase